MVSQRGRPLSRPLKENHESGEQAARRGGGHTMQLRAAVVPGDRGRAHEDVREGGRTLGGEHR